jgi:NTP pyrophosphatase (non-canonical NTP hydrolase)
MTNAQLPAVNLQRQQQEFDLAHGLSTLGASGHADPSGIDVGLAQFAVLGLCGECGEVANALKKVLRAAAFGRDSSLAMHQLRTELADVLAYLLKAASALHVDLEEEFLRTVALNCLRFPLAPKTSTVRLVGIAGDRSTVDARRLVDAVARNSQTSACVLELPHLATDDIAHVSQWLRKARDTVAGELRSEYVFVANDPAYAIMTLLNARRDMTRDDRLCVAREWLAFEQATWQAVSVRRLFLSATSPVGPVETALSQHGARILAANVDPWEQLQAIVAP